VVNWLQRDQSSLREKIDNQPLWFRWMLIIGCIFFILVYGIYGPSYDVNQFIYSGFLMEISVEVEELIFKTS
jgi:hypothetical protein